MARSPRYIIATVVAAFAVLVVATALLASLHERVRTSRTSEHVQRGNARAARGDLDGAVAQYHAALALDRDNREARRALGLALLSLERLSEAGSYLRGLQGEDPTDGELNRALARIHAARRRDAEARAGYQRAIYGEWPADAQDERIATRFELIDHLKQVNARAEVVAELVTLQAELQPGQTAAARRVADLLVEAGAPALAIDLLSASAVAAPRDVELLAQLADLQAEAGRTLEARATLKRAVAVDPDRVDLKERLAVVDRVLALDPTLPRLRLVTRTRRARLVLAAVVAQTRGCIKDEADSLFPLWEEAATRVERRAPATAEAAEEEMALAARLWTATPACQGLTPEARAIAQVLQRIEAAAEPPS